MATILKLEEQGLLWKLDPELEVNEREHRWIYGLPQFASDLDTKMDFTSAWEASQTPTQQLDALVEMFCSGETLSFGKQFKPLKPLSNGVWQLKTPDLRVFGWFHSINIFIACRIEDAHTVKTHGYSGYISIVSYLRGQLDLEEPKWITGTDPQDVVTNFNFW